MRRMFTSKELNEMLEIIKDEDLDKYTYKGITLRKWLKLLNGETCPICQYYISECQCLFGGSGHPDRSKRRDVVIEHLYLLSPKQVEHVIELERHWQMSYTDDEKNRIVEELKGGRK